MENIEIVHLMNDLVYKIISFIWKFFTQALANCFPLEFKWQ